MTHIRTALREVPPRQRLFSTAEYEQMIEAGILGPDDHVELVEGVITHMAAKNNPHATCVRRANDWFSDAKAGRYIVQVQDPIRLPPRSEPEPDIVLLRRRPDFYADRHPEAADILLVIEVVDSSEGRDRRRKLPMYARAGIAESWLFLIASRAIEAHRTPVNGRYTDVTTYQRGESLSPLLIPDLLVPVTAMLG